jgi:nitronate monooxygenase
MSTNLQNLLKIQHPIVQAPMAGTDTPQSVAAACNAGILGSLGAQYRTPQEIKDAIAVIRSLTDKPFAVNLFALQRAAVPSDKQIEAARSQLQDYYARFGVPLPSVDSVKTGIDSEAQLQAVLEAQVPVLSFTLGIPQPRWIQAFKDRSTLLIGTATNVKEARALEAAGADAITAQSSEAGGHRGTFIGSFDHSMIGAMALIPQVVDAVDIPVIAAGGIMDGRGIAAAFALGAHGVQLGTAFLTVTESPAHAAYKQAVKEHDADETAITKVFSGGAARGIENSYMAENAGKPLLPFPYQNSLTRPFRKVANESGQIEYTNIWSGQGGRLAREMALKDLVHDLLCETEEVLGRLTTVKLR